MALSACDMLHVCQNSPFVDINPQFPRFFKRQTLFLHATDRRIYLLIRCRTDSEKGKNQKISKRIKEAQITKD